MGLDAPKDEYVLVVDAQVGLADKIPDPVAASLEAEVLVQVNGEVGFALLAVEDHHCEGPALEGAGVQLNVSVVVPVRPDQAGLLAQGVLVDRDDLLV
jgi:hypothetical protein